MSEDRKFHPVADIFPMMSEREFSDLVEDIAANGLRESIWLHSDGRIIDGRNRYRACVEAGVEPVFRTYGGDDGGLVPFVVSLNLHRRHLNETQRGMVAARVANMGHGGARGTQSQDANLRLDLADEPEPSSVPAITDAQAAEMLNVSKRTVTFARKVQEQAVPELVEKVDAGEISVSTAAVIAEAPEEEQREVIAADDEKEIVRRANEYKRRKKEERQREKAAKVADLAEKAAAAARRIQVLADPARPETGQWWQLGRHRLYCGDSTDETFVKASMGATFAFADPPYNAGKADWDQGFTWQHDYLTDAADIVAVTPGISAVQDFFGSTTMAYRWSMAAWITNGMTRGALGFGNWIYIALFSQGGSLHRNAQDVLRITIDTASAPETNHASRKPARLLIDLLDLFTKQADTVVDPFLGSGTTLFAADQTGRTCVGAELDLIHCGEIIARYGPEARPL